MLVGHTGKRGSIWCGEKLSAQEEWVTKWMTRLLQEGQGPGHQRTTEVSSSSSDRPTLLLQGEEEDPETQQARLEELQNLHDAELFEWHEAQRQQEEQNKAREARCRDEATLQAHQGWSSRPPSKRLRLMLDVRTSSSSRYSEVEVKPGETVTLNIQAVMVDHGDELYRDGNKVNLRDGMQALREEEERLMRGTPQTHPSAPAEERGGWSTNNAEIRPHYEAWKEGRVDFRQLQDAVGPDRAMFIVSAAEVAGLDLDTLPDVDTANREAWQDGRPADALLDTPACKADYGRWSTGDLRTADLIDKWGGDVYRIFQAWYMEGKQPDQAAPPEEIPANRVPDESETLLPEEVELQRRRRTGEAMLRRRILRPKASRRRDPSSWLSQTAADTD